MLAIVKNNNVWFVYSLANESSWNLDSLWPHPPQNLHIYSLFHVTSASLQIDSDERNISIPFDANTFKKYIKHNSLTKS